mgnify:CR=1 FL=1
MTENTTEDEAAKETPAYPSVDQRMADLHERLMQVGSEVPC